MAKIVFNKDGFLIASTLIDNIPAIYNEDTNEFKVKTITTEEHNSILNGTKLASLNVESDSIVWSDVSMELANKEELLWEISDCIQALEDSRNNDWNRANLLTAINSSLDILNTLKDNNTYLDSLSYPLSATSISKICSDAGTPISVNRETVF